MRAGWCGAVAAAIVLVNARALADPADRGEVDVVVAPADASASAMRAVVVELIARLGLASHVTFASGVNAAELITPRAGAEPRVARVWLDLSKPDRATLYLVDREWERILIRHVRKTAGHEEIAREALGHILETAVDALAHGARIGVSREEARAELARNSSPPPAPVPPPPAPGPSPPELSPRTTGPIPRAAEPLTIPTGPGLPAPGVATPLLEVGGAYDAEIYASGGVIVSGPSATAYLGASRGRVRPGGWLSLGYGLPSTVDATPLGVRLEEGGGRILGAVDVSAGARFALRLGAGPGIDVVHVSPRLEGSARTTPGNDQTFALVIARASVRLMWSLSSNVGLTLSASVDVDTSGTRYVALVDGVAVPMLSPWPLRPALSLGVTFQQPL